MRLADTMPAALIAVACAVGAAVLASRDRPAPEPRAAPVGAAATFTAVRAGERIVGWNVAAVTTATDGAIEVTMARDGLDFVLTVAPLGSRAQAPPFATAEHAIYYGHARPPGAEIPAGALRAITAELMRRLER